MRTLKVLNAGCLFKVFQMKDEANGKNFQVIERPEFDPMQEEKSEFFAQTRSALLDQFADIPFEKTKPEQVELPVKVPKKVQASPVVKKSVIREVTKEERIWIIVREENRRLGGTPQVNRNKITIHQSPSPAASRALILQKQASLDNSPTKMVLKGVVKPMGRGRGRRPGSVLGRPKLLTQPTASAQKAIPKPKMTWNVVAARKTSMKSSLVVGKRKFSAKPSKPMKIQSKTLTLTTASTEPEKKPKLAAPEPTPEPPKEEQQLIEHQSPEQPPQRESSLQ